MRVFVTVGNRREPFDRLLEVADAVVAGSRGRLHGAAQIGYSHFRPRALDAEPFWTRDAFERAIQECDIVVCHAGVGACHIALQSGHRPIVMARRRALGECVNDHQTEIARALAAKGRVSVAETAQQLAALMKEPTRIAVAKRRTVSFDYLAPISAALRGPVPAAGSLAADCLLDALAHFSTPLSALRKE